MPYFAAKYDLVAQTHTLHFNSHFTVNSLQFIVHYSQFIVPSSHCIVNTSHFKLSLSQEFFLIHTLQFILKAFFHTLHCMVQTSNCILNLHSSYFESVVYRKVRENYDNPHENSVRAYPEVNPCIKLCQLPDRRSCHRNLALVKDYNYSLWSCYI